MSTRATINAVTVVAVALFWLVATSWQPWTLFERAGFSADFYDEQARVLLRGRLAVDPAVPGPEGFLIDGRTYLYYGPFLAIVRLPFQVFGDVFTGRLVIVSMLVAVVVLCRWSARLAFAGRRVVAATGAALAGSDRWPVGLFTAAVACSPALFAAGWISVYNETELWAFTLAVVACTCLVEWAASGFGDRRLLVGASGAALAATLTRAPIGLGVAFAIGFCGLVLAWRARSRGAASAWAAGRLAVLGGVVPLAVHAFVNWLKFGTLFSVPGGRQQLSLVDPERAAWFAGNGDSFFSTRFLTTTVVQYLRPDAIRFERLVPGIRFGPVAENLASYPLLGNTPASSLTLTATLLLILAVVGVVWLVRRRALMWGLLVVATAIGAAPTLVIGFLANRYLIDLLPPLTVAGAIGVWAMAAWAVDAPRWRTVLLAGGSLLVVWGTWVNVSLATWTLEQKSPGFTELRYAVDDALFPAPSPGLVRIEDASTVTADGDVGLAFDVEGACVGVYTAEQGRWVPLERTAPVVTNGTVGPGVTSNRLASDGWSVFYEPPTADGPAALFVVGVDGAVVFETTVDVPDGEFDDGFEYQVIVDPIFGEYLARLGDAVVFLPPDAVTGGTGDTEGGEESRLCLDLADRLAS